MRKSVVLLVLVMAFAQCAFAELDYSPGPVSDRQSELNAATDAPLASINLTLPSAELWTKTSRKSVRLSYTIGLEHTSNVTCDLYAPNGSIIKTYTLTANGTYSFSFTVRMASQGRYDYNISCYPNDAAGNPENETFSIYYDKSKPTINYLSYDNLSYSTLVVILFVPTDAVAPYVNCTAGVQTSTIANNSLGGVLASLRREGRNSIRITCTDPAKNKVTRSVRITRDTTPPSITFSLVSVDGMDAQQPNLPLPTATFRYKVSDKNLQYVEYSVDGIYTEKELGTISRGTNQGTFSVPLQAGSHFVVLGASDGGNGNAARINLTVGSAGEMPEWSTATGTIYEDRGYEISFADNSYTIAGYSYDDTALLSKINGSGAEQWLGHYEMEFSQAFWGTYATADSGSISAGSVYNITDYYEDGLLVKTDEDGNEAWAALVEEYDCDIQLYSVQEITGGGYIAAGYIYNYTSETSEGYLVKFDSDGNVLWKEVLGNTGDDWFNSVREISWGYVLAGERDDAVWVVETNASGSIIYQSTVSGGGDSYGEGMWAEPTSDGGFMLSGYLYNSDDWITHPLLVQYDSAGSFVWGVYHTFGLPVGGLSSIKETSDGNYITALERITWSENDTGIVDASAVKFNSTTFMPIWERDFGGNGYDYSYSVLESARGEYALAGSTSSPSLNMNGASMRDMWVLKFLEPDESAWPLVQSVSSMPVQAYETDQSSVNSGEHAKVNQFFKEREQKDCLLNPEDFKCLHRPRAN